MDPITIILGIFALVSSIAFAARDRQDQKQANKEAMDFNAEEAEKSRDWQEEQYNKYESVAAQMQQRQAAGLSPFDGIASMSVGSGSTASTSANQISPLSKFDSSLFSQLPGMASQVKQTKLQNKLLGEQTEGVKLDNEAKAMQNIKLAIETNDYASYYALVKEGLVKGNKLTDEQIKKAFEEARLAHVKANEAEDAYDAGVNTILTEDRLKQTQIDYVTQEIEKVKQEVDNLQIDEQFKQFTLDTARLYDRKFLDLDFTARETEVKEFVMTSDERVYMHHIQAELARLAKNEADRADALSHITNETELILANNILNAAKDGGNAFDAVLVKMLTENPVGTLNTIISLAGSLKPEITNKNYTTNKYTTYKY